MTAFLVYLIKATIAYILCYLVYWLLFRRETFFKRNRFYLLLSLIIPAILPLIQFSENSAVTELVSGQGLNWILFLDNTFVGPPASREISELIESSNYTNHLNISSYLLIIYLTGLLFFIIRIILTYIRIIKLIWFSERSRIMDMILVITKKRISPFSVFMWLVIPEYKKNHPDLNKILKHEMIHCRQNHSIDILLSELLIAFQWFNPFIWMIKSAIIRNNEFIVDKELMSDDINIKEYQYSLLANSIGEQKLAMVNNFNRSLIKKRIKMMNKKKTPFINLVKNLLILPFIVVMMLVFSAYIDKPEITNKSIMEIRTSPELLPDNYIDKSDQDQDKKKQKKKKKKGSTIYIDGKSITIKELTKLGDKKGTVQIINLSDSVDALEFSREKIYTIIEKMDVDEDDLYVMIKSDKNEDDEKTSYIGAISIVKKDDENNELIFIENLEGQIKISTGEGKTKNLYISNKDDEDKNLYFSVDEDDENNLLYFIDGKKVGIEELKALDSKNIHTISIIKGKEALKEFGEEAKNGALKIKTKK